MSSQHIPALNELGLSGRTYNALRRAGVLRTEQLLALCRREVLELLLIGKGSAAEIEAALAERGLSLAQEAAA